MRRLVAYVIVTGGLTAATRAMAAALLRAMLYHPRRYEEDPGHARLVSKFGEACARLSYILEEVSYELPGSRFSQPPLSQRAFLLRPGCPPFGDLWLLHGGNAMVSTDWFSFCWELVASPVGSERPALLLLDYPGYGANDGSPSPSSVLAAQRAAVAATLPRLAALPGQIHILGHSLGAAAGAQLAAEGFAGQGVKALGGVEPGRLVLSAPFTSIGAMAQAIFGRRLLPGWLLWLVLTQPWNNGSWVPRAAAGGWSVRIIHGSADALVPASMGQALRDAVSRAGYPCAFSEVKGADHNDLCSHISEYVLLMAPRVPMSIAKGSAL